MIELEKKKKIKLWGKIKLWETSCCGLPVYPLAHKTYSLIKALTLADMPSEEPSDQLNIKENQMPEDEKTEEAKPEGEAEAKSEEKPEEKAEGTEEKAEEKPEGEASEKSIDMTDILAKALIKAINEVEVKRGLVSPEQKVEKMQEILKKKSLGELAIMQGLFKSDEIIGGSPVEIEIQ